MSSIRIYALAKQLKVESKDLIEVCKKLGLEGKSALASLSEEEADQVKAAIQEESHTSQVAATTATPVVFQRPVPVPQDKKVRVLTQSPTGKGTEKTQRSKVDGVVAPQAEQLSTEEPDALESAGDVSSVPPLPSEKTEIPTVEKAKESAPPTSTSPSREIAKTPPIVSHSKTPESKPPKKPLVPTTPLSKKPVVTPPVPEPLVRPDLTRKTVDRSIPSLDGKRKTATTDPPESSSRQGTHKSSGPSIRLAPLPKQALKPAKPANEPAPQKPDQKLPKEAIRAAQMGASRPLTEHIRKHEEKRLLTAEGKKGAKGLPKARKGKEGSALPSDEDSKKKDVKRIRGRDGKPVDTFSVEEPRDPKKKTRTGVVSRRFNEGEADESVFFPRQFRRLKKSGQAVNTAAPRKNDIVVQLPCSVKQYAEMTGLTVANVIRK